MESYVDRQMEAAGGVDDSIVVFREEFKRSSWNKAKLDLAYAAKFDSPDSQAKNVRVASHSLWLTGALPVGSLFQCLLGGRYSYVHPKAKWQNSCAVAGRVYGGANNAKLFAECQFSYDFEPDLKTWLVNTGAEFLFAGGNWLELTLGWEKDIGGGSRLIPGVKYRITPPESFTKF
jgi:hypothetical protein